MTDDRHHQITEIILALSKSNWQKTVMVIEKSQRECEAKGIAATDDEIAVALIALCESGRLESQGDLTKWRHSEVRLPKLRYWHIVDYNEQSRKIVITRVFESGKSHLFTELEIDKVDPSSRTLRTLGRMLGEALILDTPGLRDEIP